MCMKNLSKNGILLQIHLKIWWESIDTIYIYIYIYMIYMIYMIYIYIYDIYDIYDIYIYINKLL